MKTKEGGVMDKKLFFYELEGRGYTFKNKKWDETKHGFEDDMLNMAWEMWSSAKHGAKAQSVPEGFILIKASDRNQEMLELIDQRDYMESQAEELKDKLQALYGVDFGEHSNCNFPFQNAIDYDDSDLVLVPKEPTPAMLDSARDWSTKKYGKAVGNDGASGCYKAMIEAQEPAND